MLDFQSPSFEREEEIPSPLHAGSSFSSFTKTYPHFPAWQYDVMNPDGTYNSMPLNRPEHTPNILWPDLVCSCTLSSLSLFLLGLLNGS